MNKNTAILLSDLQKAGVLDAPNFTRPIRAIGYVRIGTVAKTAETEKMEIDGMKCGVTFEDEEKVRLYVFLNAEGSSKKGPYTLHPSEVIS